MPVRRAAAPELIGAGILSGVTWIVDGMNVIGAGAGGWWRDRHGSMVRLVDELERWAAVQGEDVTVVFERPPVPPIVSSVVTVTHAPRAQANSADDEIVRLVERAPHPAAVTVVTSDRWLADRATALGAGVHSAAGFRRRVQGD